MQRLPLVLLLGAGLAFASGDDGSHVHVDLERVVEQGTVSPVEGITSAGQPDAAALAVFASSGYTTIIDMRTAGEDRGIDEPAVVKGLGMEYVVFPIDSSEDITIEKARELDALLGQYDAPVLLHCASGNRVGALLALSEYLKSGDRDAALKKGRDAGMTRLEDRVVEVIEGSGTR